jgi:hypothetical protein
MNSSSSIYVSHKLIKDIKDGLPSIVNTLDVPKAQFASLTKLSENELYEEFLCMINKHNEKIIEDVMEYMKIKLRYDKTKGSYVKENYDKYKKNYYEKNKEDIIKKNIERRKKKKLEDIENSLNSLKI